MLDDAVPVLQRKAETESSFTAEVILVDDGSKDDTCAQYTKYVSDTAATGKTGLEKITFKLLKLPRNCGKGRAVSEVSRTSPSFPRHVTSRYLHSHVGFPGLSR